MARLPPLSKTHRVCVICEGMEDYFYFNRLLELRVWNSTYAFFPLNAKSASNIPARFQDAFQNDKYEIVLVFCDTDKAPYREYAEIKRKLNSFLDKKHAADKLIIFANPCTMQIVLSHFGDVELKNQGKKTNAAVIERLTGVRHYDAHEEQIKEICSQIFRRSYGDMKRRVEAIQFGDTTPCSTNFYEFLERFENDDTKWLTRLQESLMA